MQIIHEPIPVAPTPPRKHAKQDILPLGCHTFSLGGRVNHSLWEAKDESDFLTSLSASRGINSDPSGQSLQAFLPDRESNQACWPITCYESTEMQAQTGSLLDLLRTTSSKPSRRLPCAPTQLCQDIWARLSQPSILARWIVVPRTKNGWVAHCVRSLSRFHSPYHHNNNSVTVFNHWGRACGLLHKHRLTNTSRPVP
jgi:hypothetical protein